MQKVYYEIDPYNRLVLNDAGEKGDLEEFRRVLDGQFKVDGNNNLSYHIKSPLSEDEEIPHQVKLDGNWSLTGDHKLRLALDKEGRETFGDQLTLTGEILDVDKNSLTFSVTTRTGAGIQTTYILDLQGSWKADESNRLSFSVRRERGIYDILTFSGAWEMGENHQIIYRYEKAALIRKEKEVHTLTFKGYWDIKDKTRVSYILDADSASAFDFTASVGALEEDRIKFEVGIGAERRGMPVKRAIVLFGRWTLKKDTGLLFEVEYGDKDTCAIIFGADIALSDKDTVSFKLKSSTDNKDTGITLELSRKILKGDGELFLRALASGNELAVYAGGVWSW